LSHYQIHKNFYKNSKQLRSEFENNFKDPRLTDSKRFVWDYWFFEDQYHLIRTPAFHYFSKKLYTDFHSSLVQWGRENLGCHDISPPWLSYYVDGCYQNLHSDVPHGPWAFVYSLTPPKRQFKGGETLLLKPNTLNYWNNFQDREDREYSSFVDRVPSAFNQLIVFDPRFPHGVTEVKGTRDPMQARLVVHGWFVEPRPYVVGGLSTAQVQKALSPQFVLLENILSDIGPMHGTLSLRLKIAASGKIELCKFVSNTVLSLENSSQDEKIFNKDMLALFKFIKFPQARSGSLITIPLLFK
jgi:Rps23 Pro-64 3,4-dihydroxylase Tpa1-like proline 4-hydroxylase